MKRAPVSGGRWATLRPRRPAALLAVLMLALELGYAISQETPTGRVSGRILLANSNRSLSRVEVTLSPISFEGESPGLRRARSNRAGRFRIAQVPAGFYHVSAYSRRHSVESAYLTVDEGGTTEVTLSLKRSEPDLAMGTRQRVFATAEEAYMPVRGYVDGRAPEGRDALRVRVYRTRLSSVLRDAKAAEALDRVGSPWLDPPVSALPGALRKPAIAPAPRLLSDRAVPIAGADREGFFHQRVTLGRPGPGLYLVEIGHEKKTVCAWALVTDTALIVKRAGRQMVAFTMNMTTGQPFGGSTVRAYRGARLVAEGRAGADGLAWLDVPPTESGAQLTTIALRGSDEAVVSREEYSNEEGGAFTVHAYTERPIYRPGQRIYYKGIARRNVEKGVRYAVPNGAPVTVEIRDPNGERIHRERHATNGYGSFFGHADLSPESPTGVYSMIMEVNGERHTHDIVIASYKKPEYAVTVEPAKPRYTVGETVEMTVTGRYYFDAPLAGAKVRYEVYRSVDWAAEYSDEYGYDEEESSEHQDEYEEAYGETVANGETTLDDDGRAVIRVDAKVPDTPDTAQAHRFAMTVTVTDASGREVYEHGEAQVTAGDFRLLLDPEGYVAEPGRATGVVLTARDYDGKPFPNLPVDVEYGYTDTKTGEKDEGGQPVTEYRAVRTERVTTGPDGRALVAVTPPRAGELRVNARAVDAKKRTVRGRAYLWAAGDEGGDLQTEYADLSVLTDKRRYRPGDTARVLVNAQRVGQAVLLAVEGEKVYRAFTVPMTKRSLVVNVPVRPEYGPNVFLTACYVREKRYAESEAPLRVSLPQREVRVEITPDRTPGRPSSAPALNPQPSTLNPLPRYQPGDAVSYAVRTTDLQGRPVACELSFGVVDESIYALREDSTTALRSAFYPRRYKTVQTFYSFAVEYLGDADKAEPKITARKRFPDTAYWNPTLRTDGQGRATVRFRLPDSLTTWRATAVAQTLGTALGRETSKVVVSKDFFVRLEKPRFLTERDESRLLALVHNETGARQIALVRLRVEGLDLRGDPTQTLSLEPGQVGQAAWTVTAARVGEAKLRLTAWTPRAGTDPQYTDGVEMTLPVAPHGRERYERYAGEIVSGTPEPEVLRLDPAAIVSESRLTVRITPSVAGSLAGALEYLVGYPYGCTEQTMSRFLPDILAQRVRRRVPSVLSAAASRDLPQMVRDGLARLYRFQHPTGGWGWWEYDQDDPWMTAYVLYGLGIAQAEGYPVSKNALARGRQAVVKMAAGMKDDDTRAFMLYALALAGDRETPRRMRGSFRLGALSTEALAHLVLLDKALGGDGREPWEFLDRRAVSEGGMLHWKGAPDADGDWNDRLATAAVLRGLVVVNPRDPRIPAVLRWLMANRTGEYWASTRDTAWIVGALCDYLAARPEEAATGGTVRLTINGAPFRTVALTPDTVREPEVVLRPPATLLRPDKNDLLLEREGGGTVYYSVELRQVVASEGMAALDTGGLKVRREYLRVLPKKVGEESWTLQTEPTDGKLRPGDRVRVRLTLTVPKAMTHVLIEDPFPAGCEVTERGTAEETDSWSFWYSSVDVRDDRIAFFARRVPAGTHTLEYNLRAQTPGAYHVLPTFMQGMYVPEVRAEAPEARVEVR